MAASLTTPPATPRASRRLNIAIARGANYSGLVLTHGTGPLLLAAAVLLLGHPPASSARAAGVAPSLCSPAQVGDIRPVCFPPSAAPRLERGAAGMVVTPRGLVWRVTHLRLSQVDVERWRGRLEGMDYLFGRLPAAPNLPPALGAAQYNALRPLYVLVRESTGRGQEMKPRLWRAQGSSGPGAWHFVTNFRGRNLGLSIVTNESRLAISRIGYSLLRRAGASLHDTGTGRV